MTRSAWRELLAFWIRELELSDRKITLRFVRAKAIPGADMEVEFTDREAMCWVIKVRAGKIEESEAALVHELLHIRTNWLDARDERNLWIIARALVRRRHAKA